MARPRAENSKLSFGGLELDPEEEKKLRQFLKLKDMSLAAFKRFLIREWLIRKTIPKEVL